jgi:histidine triad (HIT) family protein
MATIFSKIISGEIPCYKVAEDENHLAFFDIQPIAKGHVLVIPKKEVDYFWDLEHEDLAELMKFAQGAARTLKANFECKKVGVAVIGLEVAHAHIHLVPMNEVGDMDFSRKRLEITPEIFMGWIEKLSKR